jgi:hypothetical protein
MNWKIVIIISFAALRTNATHATDYNPTEKM